MRIASLYVLIATVILPLTAALAAGPPPLNEHGGPVKGLAVSADGTRVLTASFDYSLILWDLPGRKALAHLYGHDAAVNAVAFLPGDRRAVSASDDGTVGFWDLTRARLITRLAGHRGKVVAVAVTPDGRLAASAGWDRSVRVWDLDRQSEQAELRASDNVNAVRFTGDGRRLIAGESDGSVQIWRVADGVQLATWKAHDFGVTGLDLAPDGRLAATASIDETVQLWDLASGEPTLTLYGHEGPVLAVALSPDGGLVASGGVDGTVRVWRRGDGDRLRVYDRHGGAVWAVAFTPDGKTLLSGGADGLVVTYDLNQEPQAQPPARLAAAARGPAGDSDDGARLFRKCAACHTVTPDGGHKAGPTLFGLFGRAAGSRADYPYSKALRASHLVWTEETIARLFEIGPEELVPGSKMPLQRMPNAADRAALIAYLKRVTAPQAGD
jgi:cytochrome c